VDIDVLDLATSDRLASPFTDGVITDRHGQRQGCGRTDEDRERVGGIRTVMGKKKRLLSWSSEGEGSGNEQRFSGARSTAVTKVTEGFSYYSSAARLKRQNSGEINGCNNELET
jgi:hypothetical protein